MGLEFWEILFTLLFWVMAPVLLVSGVVGFVTGPVRLVEDIRNRDIEEAIVTVGGTVLFGAVAAFAALAIYNVVVLL